MSTPAPRRIVAIVGRPNVGKSAIFNRLVGRRVAIVHEEPGVTRDRVSCEAVWNDQRFELIDTGGLGLFTDAVAKDEITAGIRRQVEIAIEDAAMIFLVVDITSGVAPLDEEVVRWLRPSRNKVIVLANKADNARLEPSAAEFEKWSLPVFPVSALHNLGFEAAMSVAMPRLPAQETATEKEPLRVAVVGKPNAGKSSYINRILRSDRLIVAAKPGTTRDSIEIPFSIGSGPQARHYLLIDTAGLRRIRREDVAVERYSVLRAEESIARTDIAVLVIDAVEGPTMQDKKIAALILEQRKGCILLVNKWDLAEEKVTQREYEKAMRKALPFLAFVPIVFASTKSGFNIRKSIDAIDYVSSQITMTMPTATLNRVLHDATERVQAPIVQNKRMKFFYATQVGTKPVRIRLFINDVVRATDAYRKYLERCLREAYGLEGAPISLDFKPRRK